VAGAQRRKKAMKTSRTTPRIADTGSIAQTGLELSSRLRG
jgi:hypothetical protein